ncbi:MAG: GNAT family N-acetyltransferase [Proteobacteria bacterium]|nr:GNAT family N-acetyltransferase [Pseudomonadota bacterium]MBS0572962.1 GNAT family N-acetyltransferase [Pseudomonadota bacterium]
MSAIRVRAMRGADLEEVAGMIRALAEHHGDMPRVTAAALARDTAGRDPWARIRVAEAGGEIAGYMALVRLAWLQYGDRGMEIYHLFVRPAWRGRGVGRALIGRAMREARAAGCVELKVGTHPDNRAAMAYYLAQGFEEQPLAGARFRLCL